VATVRDPDGLNPFRDPVKDLMKLLVPNCVSVGPIKISGAHGLVKAINLPGLITGGQLTTMSRKME